MGERVDRERGMEDWNAASIQEMLGCNRNHTKLPTVRGTKGRHHNRRVVLLRALPQLVVSSPTDVTGLGKGAAPHLVVRRFAVVADFWMGACLDDVVWGSAIVTSHLAAAQASNHCHSHSLIGVWTLCDLVVGPLAVMAGLWVGALSHQMICCSTVVAPHSASCTWAIAIVRCCIPWHHSSSVGAIPQITHRGIACYVTTPWATGLFSGYPNVAINQEPFSLIKVVIADKTG